MWLLTIMNTCFLYSYRLQAPQFVIFFDYEIFLSAGTALRLWRYLATNPSTHVCSLCLIFTCLIKVLASLSPKARGVTAEEGLMIGKLSVILLQKVITKLDTLINPFMVMVSTICKLIKTDFLQCT